MDGQPVTPYLGGVRRLAMILLPVLLLVGCVGKPDAAPAALRESAPPWDAPRDAISYIRAAQLPELGLGDDSDPWILRLEVEVGGAPVEVPAFIGIDRLRAVQAPVHTHEDNGDVWLEGDGNRDMTLGHLFQLWGVRFDDECLGDRCAVTVTADGEPVASPSSLTLRGLKVVTVSAP